MANSKANWPTGLSDIVAPMNTEQFVTHVFGQTSHRFAGVPCFDLEAFETLLWRHESSLAERLVIYTPDGPTKPPRRRRHKDLFNWALAQYRDGATLRFEDIHTLLPWAARITGDCSVQLLSEVHLDAWLISGQAGEATFDGDQMLDLLILQSFGSSRWETGAGQAELASGQSIYVPDGRFISVAGIASPAVASVLRIRPLTPVDLLASFVEVAIESDVALRKSVPTAPDQDTAGAYAAALNCLRVHGQSAHMLEKAWERIHLHLADTCRPLPGGQLAAGRIVAELTSNDWVRRRLGINWVMQAHPKGLYVFVPGLGGVAASEAQPGGLIFPIAARPLLEAIAASHTPFRARDLLAGFTEQARLATVRKLLAEGVLEIASAPQSSGSGS